MLTVGSLFAGIGGLELGLERTGYFKTAWQVEYDPKSKKEWKDQYAVRVLNKHWPDVPKYGDITKLHGQGKCMDRNTSCNSSDPIGKIQKGQSAVAGRICPNELKYVDLICGGFPCQDISNAGKGAGIEGERSGLWKEFIRIIREVRPKYALVENVAALTQRGLYAVLADLSESGYDAEWNIVSAASVGAPHLRERIFIVAYSAGGRQQQCQSQSQSQKEDDTCEKGNDAADTTGNGLPKRCKNEGKFIFGSEKRRMLESSGGSSSKISNASSSRREIGLSRQINRQEGNARIFNDSCYQRLRRKTASQWSVEPNVGRVANGIPNRVDRLARLGNAVVAQVAQVIGEMIMEFDMRKCA